MHRRMIGRECRRQTDAVKCRVQQLAALESVQQFKVDLG
jgi:hypothetical protein